MCIFASRFYPKVSSLTGILIASSGIFLDERSENPWARKILAPWKLLPVDCRLHWALLLYGSVSQGLGTTKFTKSRIGWNGYWPRSRFSRLDRHLDWWYFEVKKLQTKMQNHWLFFYITILFLSAKSWWEKSKENEQTLDELNSAHHCSQAKYQLVQTSSIKRINFFLFLLYS